MVVIRLFYLVALTGLVLLLQSLLQLSESTGYRLDDGVQVSVLGIVRVEVGLITPSLLYVLNGSIFTVKCMN